MILAELYNLYLLRFAKQINALEKTNRLLDFIQKNENLTFGMYSNLLKELLEHAEKKKRQPIGQDDGSDYILKALVERDIFFEKLRGGNIKDFVAWINM